MCNTDRVMDQMGMTLIGVELTGETLLGVEQMTVGYSMFARYGRSVQDSGLSRCQGLVLFSSGE